MEQHTIDAGEGLLLEPVSSEHQAELFKQIDLNRNYLSTWLEWTDLLKTESDMANFILRCQQQHSDNSGYIYCVIQDTQIVGVVGFKDVTAFGDAEIGCWLSENSQGQGIMSKATIALLQYGFAHLGLVKVNAVVAQGNTKSISVCQRVGFKYMDGVERDLHGQVSAHSLLVMRKPDQDPVYNALSWIDSLCKSLDIEYLIVGGLAAFIYGSQRSIADIDIFINAKHANTLMNEVAEFVSKPLARRKEEGWDVEYAQLIFHGQKVEIGLDSHCQIFSAALRKWIDLNINIENSSFKSYRGLSVPVMPKDQLLRYKGVLAREVDELDAQAINSVE